MGAAGNPLAVHGHVSYLEIPAVDVRASVAFYAGLFGWKFRNPEASSPSFDDGTGQIIGRFHTALKPSSEPGFMLYLYVTNIHDTTSRAPGLGGAVVQAPVTD